VNLLFGALFRTLFPPKVKDAVGRGLFWAFGAPLLVFIGGGSVWLAARDGGIFGALGLLGGLVASLTAIVVALMLLGKVFMVIGTGLEARVGERVASGIAFGVVAAIVGGVLFLAANGPSGSPEAREIDPTKPMTEAECKLYVIVHPQYRCELVP